MITRNLRHRARSGVVAVLLGAALLQPPAAAEPGQQSPGEAYAAMGFGVFMHYGLATFVGQTPWNYDPNDVPATVYDPPNFDPDQWMDAIAVSGAEYIILTTKHHDGFVMWPSAYTDYGVQASSAPDTDVVGEVVRAARERDLKVVLYYSWFDKLQPGGNVRPQDPSSDRTTNEPEYLDYVKNQLRELLTNYGYIEGIWLDIAPMDDVQLPELADFVHTVSPGTALVPNFPNAIRDDNDAADVATFEGPMEVMPCEYEGKPAEQAYTVAAGPGWWQASDDALPTRDTNDVLSVLTSTQAVGATFSLNVSPGPSGWMPAGGVRLLEAIGDRLRGDDLLADAATTAGGETSDHPAEHGTDLLTRTYWQPDGDDAWLQVDLDQPVTINRTEVQFTTADAVSGYQIQYQNADGDWRTTGASGTPSHPTQTDDFRGVTTSSLRLVLNDPTDSAGVIEFKAYGGLDDTSAAATYFGTWQTLGRPAGAPDGTQIPNDVPFGGAFNESIHRSRHAGDTATFTFTGNGATLHTSTGPDQGTALVSIDDSEPQLVDLYQMEASRDKIVYQRDLESGEHTLTVEVTGERNDDARGTWVTLDRITPLAVHSAEQDTEPYEVLPDGRLIYDDGGNRCGVEKAIQYSGSWSSGSWPGAHDDSRHYSREPGAHAELTFDGTGVAVMTQTRPGHGIAAISVDGGEPQLVDTYSNPPQDQVIVWEKTGLPPGEHTVRIEVTGDSNPAATNRWVALDAIVVTP